MQYLAIERRAEQRSEYYAGEMLLLAGASRPHGRIASNIVIERDCHVQRPAGAGRAHCDLAAIAATRKLREALMKCMASRGWPADPV